MTERVWSSNPIYLEPEGEFFPGSFFPIVGYDSEAWIQYLRVYELVPTLADRDAMDVIADALAIRNRDSVDTVIRESGIAGCWRPSTVLVGRFTNYAVSRLLVESYTVAHALWNVDLDDPADRHTSYGFELYNDEKRPRTVRVTISWTDAYMRRGHRVDERVGELERALISAGSAVQELRERMAMLERRLKHGPDLDAPREARVLDRVTEIQNRIRDRNKPTLGDPSIFSGAFRDKDGDD